MFVDASGGLVAIMTWNAVLEGRSLQARLLDIVLLGLVLLVASLSIESLSDAPEVRSTPPPPLYETKAPRVEILNACGAAGVALRFADFLRARRVDIVEVGNYKRYDVAESMVVDIAGDLDAARQVAFLLGIARKDVIQQINSEYPFDVSVIIGKNYEDLYPYQP